MSDSFILFSFNEHKHTRLTVRFCRANIRWWTFAFWKNVQLPPFAVLLAFSHNMRAEREFYFQFLPLCVPCCSLPVTLSTKTDVLYFLSITACWRKQTKLIDFARSSLLRQTETEARMPAQKICSLLLTKKGPSKCSNFFLYSENEKLLKCRQNINYSTFSKTIYT